MLKKLKERCCCCKSNRTSVPALSMVGSVVVMAALAALTGLYLAVYETGRSTRTKAVTATVWPLGVVLFGASAALLWHAVRVSARTRGMSPSAALRWVLEELRTPGFSHTKHPLSSTKTQRADVAAVVVVAAGAVLLLAALAGLSGAVATNRSGGNTTVRAAALNGGQRVVAPQRPRPSRSRRSKPSPSSPRLPASNKNGTPLSIVRVCVFVVPSFGRLLLFFITISCRHVVVTRQDFFFLFYLPRLLHNHKYHISNDQQFLISSF